MSLNALEKAVLSIGGVILVFNQPWLNAIGICVVALLLGYNWMQAHRTKTAAAAHA